jgi:hypothetical protein
MVHDAPLYQSSDRLSSIPVSQILFNYVEEPKKVNCDLFRKCPCSECTGVLRGRLLPTAVGVLFNFQPGNKNRLGYLQTNIPKQY